MSSPRVRTRQRWILLALLPAVLGTAHARGAGEEVVTDPTRPLNFEAPSTDAAADGRPAPVFSRRFEVSSILIRSDTRIAVINSQRVREGGTVDNARVVEIHPASVILEVNGQQGEVQLHQRSIKSRSQNDG